METQTTAAQHGDAEVLDYILINAIGMTDLLASHFNGWWIRMRVL
ncbi:hypothetical protein [Algoriphagus sp. AGSA1]|nr:hypothetical protein [Algoriphagus sp. AGSA1]